jgi:hypothetical protein
LQENEIIQEQWKESTFHFQNFPRKYRIYQFKSANIDLLKSLFTAPNRAMEFSIFIYLSLFILTLFCFSIVHSTLVILTSKFEFYELTTFITGCTRIFLSTSTAILIAIPGVILMWVITPEISFSSTFKRFLFYYESVILFSLLGELFFSKLIIDSAMKLQPFVVILAGVLAIKTLHQSLENQPNIQIARVLIVGILIFSYLQAFLIVDELIPYHIQDNIESPFTILIKTIFNIIFG